MNIDEFDKKHPFPSTSNVSALYRFMSVNSDDPKFLEDLFSKKKLYHSSLKGLNDPFEDKAVFTMKNPDNNAGRIRKHLIKMSKKNQMTTKEAENMVSKGMRDPNFLTTKVSKAASMMLDVIRICCYTTDKESLLFWSHYANSHKGICVEFDALIKPMTVAQKVEYSNDYPQIVYPIPLDRKGFRPVLMKSKVWEYENEYRSVFVPGARGLPMMVNHCC